MGDVPYPRSGPAAAADGERPGVSVADAPQVRILISSCLLGERVRYDGGAAAVASGVLDRWRREGRLVPFCPEVAAGLAVPRPPVEIEGGRGGAMVLDGAARVADAAGREATADFVHGARQALRAARDAGVELAILKDGSPSCGSSYIYDGSFSGSRLPGRGVTAELLERHGVRVFSEAEIAEAADYLSTLSERRQTR